MHRYVWAVDGAYEEWISFDGKYFGEHPEAVTVSFGGNACFLDGNPDFNGEPGSLTDTQVKCRISGRLANGTFPIQITVGGQTSGLGSFCGCVESSFT